MRKEYDRLARTHYFETIRIKLKRNKSIEDIDKKHEIDSKIDFR